MEPASIGVICGVFGAAVAAAGAVIIEVCRKRSVGINKSDDSSSADNGNFTAEGFELTVKNGSSELTLKASKLSANFIENDSKQQGINAHNSATGHDTNPLAGQHQNGQTLGAPTVQTNPSAQLPAPDVALQIPATASDLAILQSSNPDANHYKIGKLSATSPNGTVVTIENSNFDIVPESSTQGPSQGPQNTHWVRTGSEFLGGGLNGLFQLVGGTISSILNTPSQSVTPTQTSGASTIIDIGEMPLPSNATDQLLGENGSDA